MSRVHRVLRLAVAAAFVSLVACKPSVASTSQDTIPIGTAPSNGEIISYERCDMTAGGACQGASVRESEGGRCYRYQGVCEKSGSIGRCVYRAGNNPLFGRWEWLPCKGDEPLAIGNRAGAAPGYQFQPVGSIPVGLGMNWQKRMETYYNPLIGNGVAARIYRGVGPFLVVGGAVPLVQTIRDDFPDGPRDQIAVHCSKTTRDVFSPLGCISANVHAWLEENITFDRSGVGASEAATYCMSHDQGVKEVFYASSFPKRGVEVGSLLIQFHILDRLTIQQEGQVYAYAFDAGHGTETLRFYPYNDAAIRLTERSDVLPGAPREGSELSRFFSQAVQSPYGSGR
jgi:hypothetical protein